MKRTVIAFGSFDILHPGHLKYLNEARKLGDRLVVVVARDDSFALFKGRKPVMGQNDRARIVGSLRMVDLAVVGNRIRHKSDIYRIFLKYNPSVIALGYDQRADVNGMKRWLKEHGMRARIVRIRRSLNEKWYKSSKIKRALASSFS
jgi:FAD synthetase